jgi:hypothetical protein
MVVTLIAVILGIIVAVRWGESVVREAKEAAERAAQMHIEGVLGKWLNDEAPGLVRTHVELILAQSPPTPAADAAADKMGEQA